MTFMEPIASRKGKDAAPEETVRRIKAILETYGYEATYEAQAPQLGTCYFSRVTVNDFGSNGAYCMASGYAELMERMQNRVMSMPARHLSRYSRMLTESFPTSDLKQGIHPCITGLKERLLRSAPQTEPEDACRMLEELIQSFAPGGRFILRPFYSADEQKEVLLPVTFLQLFTGTNGMAAGNTLEEAIVQGLSEIFERYATMQILSRGLTPPEIPREFIAERFPRIHEIIQTIEEDPTYRVSILDASLGLGIPCVACVIHNRQTLTLGVKFGAYPSMEIALERCFSEAVQGWKLWGFSKAGAITYSPMGRASWVEILNILKISKGVYPATILGSHPHWTFRPWDETCCVSNRAMLRRQLEILRQMGRNVYIQDVSFLGFPSVYLYVPEMSEIAPVDTLWLQERQLMLRSQDIFAKLSAATDADVEQLLTTALIKRGSMLENTIDRIAGAAFSDPMPGNPSHEMEFLAGVCCYRLGRDKQALSFFRNVPQTPYSLAIIHFLTALLCGKTSSEAAALLEKLTDPDTAHAVADAFSDRGQVLQKLYPTCSGDCDTCRTRCGQRRIQAEYEKLLSIELQTDPGTESLCRLFAEI